MLTQAEQDYLKTATITMQIIVCALAAGVAIFAGIVIFQAQGSNADAQPKEPFLAYIGVGFAALATVLWIVVPRIVVGHMRQSIVDGKPISGQSQIPNAAGIGTIGPLTIIYQMRLIVASAILEGAAFLNLVAYMLEHQVYNLSVAGVLLLFLLGQFPTVSRIQAWIENELSSVKQLRQLGPTKAG